MKDIFNNYVTKFKIYCLDIHTTSPLYKELKIIPRGNNTFMKMSEQNPLFCTLTKNYFNYSQWEQSELNISNNEQTIYKIISMLNLFTTALE